MEVLKTEVKNWRDYAISEFEFCLGFCGIGQRALLRRKDIKKCLLKGVLLLWSVREALQIAPPYRCSTACFNTGQVRWGLSPPPLLPSTHFISCQVCLFHRVSPAGYTYLSSLCPACAELCRSGCTLPSHCFDSGALEERPLLLAPDHSARLQGCLCWAGRCRKSLILHTGLFLAKAFQR